jgi:NTP pyrophosphatase (non-canonical NTP hydrolase)
MTVVLLEEVFEALAQAVHGDPEALRKELGQVAAVAVKWMEIIDCRLAEELERETDGLYAATGRRRGLNFDEVKSLRTNRPEIIAKPMIVDLTLPEVSDG